MIEYQDPEFFLSRNAWVTNAVRHGELAVFYLTKINDPASLKESTFSQEWDVNHARSEAEEAWHYAIRLWPAQVEEELTRQELERRSTFAVSL